MEEDDRLSATAVAVGQAYSVDDEVVGQERHGALLGGRGRWYVGGRTDSPVD